MSYGFHGLVSRLNNIPLTRKEYLFLNKQAQNVDTIKISGANLLRLLL